MHSMISFRCKIAHLYIWRSLLAETWNSILAAASAIFDFRGPCDSPTSLLWISSSGDTSKNLQCACAVSIKFAGFERLSETRDCKHPSCYVVFGCTVHSLPQECQIVINWISQRIKEIVEILNNLDSMIRQGKDNYKIFVVCGGPLFDTPILSHVMHKFLW